VNLRFKWPSAPTATTVSHPAKRELRQAVPRQLSPTNLDIFERRVKVGACYLWLILSTMRGCFAAHLRGVIFIGKPTFASASISSTSA
jgi:hypothetical protein